MGNTSLEYASTSSDQDSVRSRGSVIPSGQYTISRGNGNVYQLAVFEAEKSKKEASLEAFKHQEVEKEKNEAIKRVTCTYCNCPLGMLFFPDAYEVF